MTLPESIFSADIIYSTITSSGSDSLGKDVLGYYSIEKQIAGTVELSYLHPANPHFLNSSTIIFFDKSGNYGSINGDSGKIVILTTESEMYCENLKGTGINPFQDKIVFYDGNNINLVSSENCNILSNLINKTDLARINNGLQIGSFSVSPQGDFVILESDSNLYMVSLKDKSIKEYDATGVFPAISPDGKSVAFLAGDGIHTMEINGENNVLVVPYKASDGLLKAFSRGIPPKPEWSPENNNLVYHKCLNQVCLKIDDYGIYTYNLVTKIETQIVKGGLNPSWNIKH